MCTRYRCSCLVERQNRGEGEVMRWTAFMYFVHFGRIDTVKVDDIRVGWWYDISIDSTIMRSVGLGLSRPIMRVCVCVLA